MQTKIAKIGNEFGLVLPKSVLDACGFGTDATVTVQNKTLIVTPSARKPREGWSEAIDAIPQDVLKRDFKDLEDFRDAPDEQDLGAWQLRDKNKDEKI